MYLNLFSKWESIVDLVHNEDVLRTRSINRRRESCDILIHVDKNLDCPPSIRHIKEIPRRLDTADAKIKVPPAPRGSPGLAQIPSF